MELKINQGQGLLYRSDSRPYSAQNTYPRLQFLKYHELNASPILNRVKINVILINRSVGILVISQ